MKIQLHGGPLNKQVLQITAEEFERGITHAFVEGKTAHTYVMNQATVWSYVDPTEKPNAPALPGRIVWYMPTEKEAEQIPGIDFSKYYAENYLPAMIVRGFSDGKVNLKVFCGPFDFYVEDVPYTNTAKMRTWRWPIKPVIEQFMDLIN